MYELSQGVLVFGNHAENKAMGYASSVNVLQPSGERPRRSRAEVLKLQSNGLCFITPV